MTIVVDASVALKWVIEEPGSDEARSLRGQALSAPAVWLAEAANTLWRKARKNEITVQEARSSFALLQAAPVAATPVEMDIAEALTLAVELDHPVYDCLYLAAALREDAYVLTADMRFARAVARHADLKDRVRKLGD